MNEMWRGLHVFTGNPDLFSLFTIRVYFSRYTTCRYMHRKNVTSIQMMLSHNLIRNMFNI